MWACRCKLYHASMTYAVSSPLFRCARSSKYGRHCSTQANEEDVGRDERKSLAYYRTSLTNPADHTWNNVGQFYNLQPTEVNRLFYMGGFPELTIKEFEAINEISLMVREPALEVISYLKQANYNMNAIRYVIYGREGVGKTLTLAHIMHYCAANGWFIIHRPLAQNLLLRVPWADSISNIRDSRLVDYPSDGAKTLKALMKVNGALMEQYNLETSKEYTWSKREVTSAGTNLKELVDFGLSRPKYSCDVVGAVIREIRTQASSKGYKVLVAVDGVNTWFGDTDPKLKRSDRTRVQVEDITLVANYLRTLRNDWSGGAVVCTVHDKWAFKMNLASPLPRHLLTQRGFELFDPFVPVEVREFTEEEADNMLQYYIDSHWLTAEMDESKLTELKHVSSYNPRLLQDLVSHL